MAGGSHSSTSWQSLAKAESSRKHQNAHRMRTQESERRSDGLTPKIRQSDTNQSERMICVGCRPPAAHTHTHIHKRTMVFTTLLCKFYSQLQLNGVCFVHRRHRASERAGIRKNTGASPQPHSALLAPRENKFSCRLCRRMLRAIRINGEKRKRPKPNGKRQR